MDSQSHGATLLCVIYPRVVEQTLDPANGLYRLTLEHDDHRGSRRSVNLYCFVNRSAGHVCIYTDGVAPFASVATPVNVSFWNACDD
jgi:hypothetical protein